MFKKIRKRDGRVVRFDSKKIADAIAKAGAATGEFDHKIARALTLKVLNLAQQAIPHRIPTVEGIQDVVEEVLLSSPYRKTARAYIIYREQHAGIREITAKADVDMVDQYLEKLDWQVNENSNMTFSLQGLNNYISSEISKTYWLIKIYPSEVRQAHLNGDFHIHDLNILSVYCVGWDLFDLLVVGFRGAPGKVESEPAKHFRSALGQAVNFFYSLQGEAAGAQAFSFDAQTPITIKRNGKVESVTLEMLFGDYKHHTKELNNSEVILTENIYRRYLIDDADKRKYLDSRMPTEPILFQSDKIEVLIEDGFVPLKVVSRHKIETQNDKLLIIETEDGNVLRVTRSHPMVLADKTIKRADELKAGEELLSASPNLNLTEEIELQDDFAYLVGFMIAEGCWGHQTKDYSVISQKKKTKERVKVESILKKLKIPYSENREFNIVFGTTRMGRFIRNHLGLQNKSHRKNLPVSIFNLKKENIGDIISGLIDGDGDIDRERIVRIHSTSYTLLMQLKQILRVLGINSTVRYAFYKNAKENYKDAYVIRFRVDEDHLSLFDQSIKLQNIKPKTKESPKFSSKVVKIIDAKYDNEYVYDITTKNEFFLINNIVVHNSNFDTLLAPFIRADGLGYEEVKQALQEFVFNVNVPTRVGFQAPFTNITLDLTVPEYYANQSVVIGGVPQKETYNDFKDEMEMFNRALLEVMGEGDAKGRVFTFPIPTYNITKDFDWANPNLGVLWQVTAKYGVPYFSNFINSDMNPEDARSMCCRLRIDNRELERRGGGLFGSSPLTGSIGVVTINMPRLGYSSARDEEDFIMALERLMVLAKESLEIKRKVLENFMDKNLYPYTKYYLRGVKERFGEYWKNHFSTIGLVGMNEACLNMFGENIASEKSRAFTSRVLDFMRDKLLEFQAETGNNYNLEATPAEGTSYRLAKKDKESNPKIICANEEDWKKGAEPFYTNSTQLPVNYTDDVFEALDLQDEIQTKYTGGTVVHIFAGERVHDSNTLKALIRKICELYHLPYFTFTPTFSVCPSHGYIAGEHFACPTCGAETEVYSRVVGYLRPVNQWNRGKQEEFKNRKTFDIR